VAQELLGYQARREGQPTAVVNYSSDDVSSWSDIHNSAQRLVFLSDSPGLPRYAKSAFRTLVSWNPHWTLVCVAADEGAMDRIEPHGTALAVGADSIATDAEQDTSFQHLRLCLNLGLPIVVTVTKLDIATRLVLRSSLAQTLSILKDNGRKPVLLASATGPGSSQPRELATDDLRYISLDDAHEAERVLDLAGDDIKALVPVVLASSVTGVGLGRLHALLERLPCLESER
jgi:GTPase